MREVGTAVGFAFASEAGGRAARVPCSLLAATSIAAARIVIVLSGGNVDTDMFAKLIG